MSHGNYRRVHYTEAIAEAEDRDEILVTLDDVLVINQGSEAAVAIHIVGEPNLWEHDEPKAYQVELVRPRWLYGSEGHLYPLRWVGRVNEPTDAEFEILAADESHPYWDLIPESGSFLWAVPKVPAFSRMYSESKSWQRCELPWWNAFREVQP